MAHSAAEHEELAKGWREERVPAMRKRKGEIAGELFEINEALNPVRALIARKAALLEELEEIGRWVN